VARQFNYLASRVKGQLQEGLNILDKFNMFGFDRALIHLKNGKSVTRIGWKISEEFIIFGLPRLEINAEAANGSGYITSRDAAEVYRTKYARPVLSKLSSKGILVGWLPTLEDLMEEDWVLYQD